MRQFQTSVLDRKQNIEDGCATEPFEAAWAGEAVFFIEVQKISGGTHLSAYVQISPDGIRWADEGTVLEGVAETGMRFLKVSHFGGWLRLRFSVTGGDRARDDSRCLATIRLVLKE